jgi:hypothetical protein
MTRSQKKAAEVMTALNKDGSITLKANKRKDVRRKGYYVSIKGFEETISMGYHDSVLHHFIESFIERRRGYVGHQSTLPYHELFYCFWLHDGKLYCDITTVIRDRDRAIAVAHQNEQKAIFDIANGITIYV